MKLIAALSASAVLSLSALALHASPIEPFGNGTTLLFNGTALDSTTAVTPLSHGIQFTSNNSLITLTYVTTPAVGLIPATSLFNFTDVCTSLSAGIGSLVLGTPCKPVAISFSDANFGLVSVSAAVGLNLSESVAGDVANLNVAQNGSLGATTAAFTFVDPVTPASGASPVPEPGTLSLMATGLVGAAGAIRRKFRP